MEKPSLDLASDETCKTPRLIGLRLRVMAKPNHMTAPLLALAAGNFAIGTGALVISGVVSEMAGSLGVQASAIGLLVTIYAFTYAVAAPFMSALAGRYNQKMLLIGAMLGLAAANGILAITESFAPALFWRAIAAIFAAFFTPIASAVAVSLVPADKRGSALGIVFGGLALSTVLGVPFGTWIAAKAAWPATFLLVGALALLAALMLLLVLPRGAKGAGAGLGALKETLQKPKAVFAVSVTFFQMTAQLSLFTFIAVYLGVTVIDDPGVLTLALTVFGLASFIGNGVGGYLVDKIGTRRVLYVALGLLPFALASMAGSVLGVWTSLAAIAFWGLVGFAFSAPQQARLIELYPAQSSVILALNASALYLGTAAGSALGGFVVARDLTEWLWLVAALAAVLALVVYAWSVAIERQRATRSESAMQQT